MYDGIYVREGKCTGLPQFVWMMGYMLGEAKHYKKKAI